MTLNEFYVKNIYPYKMIQCLVSGFVVFGTGARLGLILIQYVSRSRLKKDFEVNQKFKAVFWILMDPKKCFKIPDSYSRRPKIFLKYSKL